MTPEKWPTVSLPRRQMGLTRSLPVPTSPAADSSPNHPAGRSGLCAAAPGHPKMKTLEPAANKDPSFHFPPDHPTIRASPVPDHQQLRHLPHSARAWLTIPDPGGLPPVLRYGTHPGILPVHRDQRFRTGAPSRSPRNLRLLPTDWWKQKEILDLTPSQPDLARLTIVLKRIRRKIGV